MKVFWQIKMRLDATKKTNLFPSNHYKWFLYKTCDHLSYKKQYYLNSDIFKLKANEYSNVYFSRMNRSGFFLLGVFLFRYSMQSCV